MTWLTWLALFTCAQPADVPSPAYSPAVDRGVLHAGFTREQLGSGPTSYWLLEPDEPRPERAPVVVFFHGWLALNPGLYGAWVEHLVRRGQIVIYPRYHDEWTAPADFLPNAVASIQDAFDVLEGAEGHVRPDRERFATIGHSVGGTLAAQLAANWEETGLPQPRSVLSIMPGEVITTPGPDLARVAPETVVAVAVGDMDLIAGDAMAHQIFEELTAVPAANKLFVYYRSDLTHEAPLVADHFAPTAALQGLDTGEGPFRTFQMQQARLDELDTMGFWRLGDIVIEAGFQGRSLTEATADGERLRTLGSDEKGRPLRAPLVSAQRGEIPRIRFSRGLRLFRWNPAALLPGSAGTATPRPSPSP